MSDEELRELDTHALQLTAVRNTERIFGKLEALDRKIGALDERQDRFEANLDGALACIRGDAQAITKIEEACKFHQCETQRQDKRVSELAREVSVQEGAGRVFTAQVSQTWKTVAVAVGALAVVAALVLALLK